MRKEKFRTIKVKNKSREERIRDKRKENIEKNESKYEDRKYQT